MKLPVCVFDLESDMLCPSCQERLDRGELSAFDIEFSKWIMERAKEYPELEDLNLLRAVRTNGRLILVVGKKNSGVLQSAKALMDEIKESFGEVLIFESPVKLRRIVRSLIEPAIEVGVNSLHLPDGFRESIVMLRPEDRDRIAYSKEDLREIVSAVMGESVLFQYQDERIEKDETSKDDAFGEKLREFSVRRRTR
ncbi:MAG: hypothetical protein AM324_003645 [Candidatus Thorarchaeota archaeon SMTZ1-83]|nr:MAG: hypothetical protein AM324_04670 [Candidatus Thorarchaeota archaeon SMTZ1-83]